MRVAAEFIYRHRWLIIATDVVVIWWLTGVLPI